MRVYFNLCLCLLFVRVFLFVCAYFSLCVCISICACIFQFVRVFFQFVRVYFNLCACISICACVFQFVRAYFNLCVFALLGYRSPGPRRAVCPPPQFSSLMKLLISEQGL